MDERRLVLASASPRRRELMTMMGLDFLVCPADVDEHVTGEPQKAVALLAERKAIAAAALHPHDTVLGSDTLVFCEGETLGKPRDEADALRMLQMLSDNTNTVYTGVCLIDGATGKKLIRTDSAKVHFVPLDRDSMLRYVRSGEPMDKAGAYAVQGMGGMFVSSIEGSPSTVIGLPMHLVREMLRAVGWEL